MMKKLTLSFMLFLIASIGYQLMAQTNDVCADAIPLPVNANLNCGMTTNATIAGATDSSLDTPPEDNTICGGTENDDIWFSFVATSTTHQLSLTNITGSTTDLYHSVWSGSCGALTNIVCRDPNTTTLNGLTVGDTYYVRVYSWTATTGQDSVFDVCIGTPCLAPTASAVATCQFGDDSGFYVELDVTSLGLGNTDYTLDIGGMTQSNITTTGISTYGPFPNGIPVDLTITGVADNACGLTIADLNKDCTCDPLAVEAGMDTTFCPGDTPIDLSATLADVIPGMFVDYTITSGAAGSCTATPDDPADCVDLGLGDDNGSGPLPLGFTVDFFGVPYSDVCVSSNGYVTFNCVDETDLSEDTFPSPNDPNAIIALFWDDLNPSDTISSICAYNSTIDGQTCFVADYQSVPHFGGGETVTGQIIICQDGSITVNCIDCQSDGGTDSAGQGIENEDGSLAYFDPAFPDGEIPGTSSIANCVTFTPNSTESTPCTFVGWVTDLNDIPGTIIDTTEMISVSPAATTTYYSVVDCNGIICTDTLTITVDLSLCCPIATVVTDDNGTVCTGGGTDDFATWQAAVVAANPMGLVYSSVAPVAGTTAPDTVLPDGNHSTSIGCASEDQIVMAYVYCDVDGSGTDNAGDTYSLVSIYTLTVFPIPDVTNATGGTCTDAVTDNCGGLTILYNGATTAPMLSHGDADLIVNWTATIAGAPAGCEVTGSYTLTCPCLECPDDIVTDCDSYTGAHVSWDAPTIDPNCPIDSTECGAAPYISGFIYAGTYNDSHYYCSTNNYTWTQANTICQANGGYLASINNSGENAFIRNFIMASSAWIGYHDSNSEDNFQWVNGDPTTYDNWQPGQPNNLYGTEHYTRIRKDSGQWTDKENNTYYECVMEVPCSSGSWQQIAGPPSGSFFTQNTTTNIMYQFTDNGGNQYQCSFTVTVNACDFDCVACPEDVVLDCDPQDGGVILDLPKPDFDSSCMIEECEGEYISGFIYIGSYQGSKYYCSYYSDYTWEQADYYSQVYGGHLVTINNPGENAYVSNALMTSKAWIGCHDKYTEGTFQWSNGEPMNYDNWYANQPNDYYGQDYCKIFKSNGQWADYDNHNRAEFVMEIPCDGGYWEQIAGPGDGTWLANGSNSNVTYEFTDSDGTKFLCSYNVSVEECDACDISVDINNEYNGYCPAYSVNTFNADVYNGTGPYTYEWQISGSCNLNGTYTGGSTLSIYNYPGSATINLIVTDANGCSGSQTYYVQGYSYGNNNGSSKDGISSVDDCMNKAFCVQKVYPTLTQDIVNINFTSQDIGDMYFQVHTQNGSTVFEQRVTSRNGWNQEQLDLGNLPAGMYYISMYMNGEIQTTKIVKQ